MTFRNYQADRDLEAVRRIYREVGWISEKAHEQAIQELLESGRGLVAELDGSAECFVLGDAGSIRHLETDIPLCVVVGVTTSRIARKQGLASRLTAQLLAEEAERGQAAAMLGIFEQAGVNIEYMYGFTARLGVLVFRVGDLDPAISALARADGRAAKQVAVG